MFEHIRDIFDDLLAARERRANIRYFEGLSDRVLRDIGVERSEIESLFDASGPGRSDWKQASAAYETKFAPCG
jgi:uncharacterized protein YjiS (DUF1127 family)